ncbi:MAG TPA: hypothetical protein PLY51_09075 [Microthrixaceae bacterium]|nr:hypothetical protein [Microthrixaceae bacterium]
MIPAVIATAGERTENIWTVIGLTITAIGGVIGAYYGYKAKRNTEPNDGSSPHDRVLAEVDALTRSLQLVDERLVIDQRRSESIHQQLLDGQQRLEHRQARLEDRQTEQAHLVDRILVQLDVAGAQADATVELVHKLNQTGG